MAKKLACYVSDENDLIFQEKNPTYTPWDLVKWAIAYLSSTTSGVIGWVPKIVDNRNLLDKIYEDTQFIVESIKKKKGVEVGIWGFGSLNTDLWQKGDFDNECFTYAQDLNFKPEFVGVKSGAFKTLKYMQHPILWWDCWGEGFTREINWQMVQWIMSEKQMMAYRSKLEYYKSNFKSDKSRWTDDRDIKSLMIRDKKSDYDGLLHLALAKHVIDSGEDRTQYMSEELYDLANWNK